MYLLGLINENPVAHVETNLNANLYNDYISVCDKLYDVTQEQFGAVYRYFPYRAQAYGNPFSGIGDEIRSGTELWETMEEAERLFDSGTCTTSDASDIFHFYIVNTGDLKYLAPDMEDIAEAIISYCDELELYVE